MEVEMNFIQSEVLKNNFNNTVLNNTANRTTNPRLLNFNYLN